MFKEILLYRRHKGELHFALLLLFHITEMTSRVQNMRLCWNMGKDIK